MSPDLYRDLQHYADIYQAQFGDPSPFTELIPYMLADFLGSDRGFAKACKERMSDTSLPIPADPIRTMRRSTVRPPSTVIGEL